MMILIAATITERLLQKSVSNSELTIAKYPPICLVADRNMERASCAAFIGPTLTCQKRQAKMGHPHR